MTLRVVCGFTTDSSDPMMRLPQRRAHSETSPFPAAKQDAPKLLHPSEHVFGSAESTMTAASRCWVECGSTTWPSRHVGSAHSRARDYDPF